MTTIINNPGGETGGDSAIGIIVGVIIGIILIALFVIYGLPAIRTAPVDNTPNESTNINVTIPNPVMPESAPEK